MHFIPHKHLTINIHTWRELHHRSFLQSFFIPEWKKNTVQEQQHLNPVLTSLEEEVVPGYIQFTGHLAQGGAITHGIKWNQLMESPSMPDLCLAEPDLSLTECNCQSGGWSDWHLNLLTEPSTKTHQDEPKTCGGEREGEIPHKGCSRSTLDLIWSPPQSRICQI